MRLIPEAWMKGTLLLVLQAMLLPGALAQEWPLQVVGRAFDESGEQLLYSEYHYCDSELACMIEYRKPDGELIARKDLDYSYGPHSPALVMIDYLSGKEVRLGFSEREDVVVDAGFDNYVRSRWGELSGGESIEFPFQVVGFDQPLAMKAYRANQGSCALQELCLEVSLDSWFLGLLVDPIVLSYARDSRRLLRFRGVSNLRDDKGKTFQVDIRYEYANNTT